MTDDIPEGHDDAEAATVGVDDDGASGAGGDFIDDPDAADGDGDVADDDDGDDGADTEWSRPTSSRRRRAAFAVLRSLIVLLAAVIVYQFVIPTSHVVRSRLTRLVPAKSGVAAFDKITPHASEPDDTQTSLAALTNAAKRSPNKTGLYSIEWSQSQTSGAGVVAFLLPSDAVAGTALSQLETQQLAAGSYSSESLTRTSTYAVPGVPGSKGAVFQPSAKAAATTPSVVITLFRYGNVVALSEVANPGSSAQSDADIVAQGEYANLRHLGAGFSLSVTRYPVVATTLWGVGAVMVAALAALLPIGRRRLADRRRRAYEEEMAHRVVVGNKVIVKHRR